MALAFETSTVVTTLANISLLETAAKRRCMLPGTHADMERWHPLRNAREIYEGWAEAELSDRKQYPVTKGIVKC